MRGDAWMVLALMLGLVTMIGLGVWCRLEDATREEIAEARTPLLAGAGVLAGVVLLLVTA
jgi:hypothetical protein